MNSGICLAGKGLFFFNAQSGACACCLEEFSPYNLMKGSIDGTTLYILGSQPVKPTDKEAKCVYGCKRTMAKMKFKTVDEDYKYYKRCLSSSCGIGGMADTPDDKTCVFLCEASTHAAGYTSTADYENYLR